jgi:arabinose-5-phosphate isomerase
MRWRKVPPKPSRQDVATPMPAKPTLAKPTLASLKPAPAARDDAALLQELDTAIGIQIAAMERLRAALQEESLGSASRAIGLILAARGRVIVTGIGKSGAIARKIASTLSSTGTPAYFVHAAEASHGDLGMITPDDVLLALSWSGETSELLDILHFAKRAQVPLIAMTSGGSSTLARHADVVLLLPKVREVDPHGLAPSSSTLIQLALGDAMAITLSQARGFGVADFRARHPGGKLGVQLLQVKDVMATGEEMPLAPESAAMADVIVTMSGARFGCVGIVNAGGELTGIITDGDIRRHMSRDFLDQTAAEIMTYGPKVLPAEMLASDALTFITQHHINGAFVLEGRKPIGLVHLHDLLRLGVA